MSQPTRDEAILTHFEKAARIFCGKQQVDPDEQLVLPVPADQTVLLVNGPKQRRTAPRWHFVAIELHDLSMRLLSLKEAVQEPTPAKAPRKH